MVKLSIVVPIYNVEKYLTRCIESILNQTFTDFELILVDDGSPDNCGKMCDEYAKKDSRIRVLHKKNGGLSDARNHGIDIAKADYISFVDSDDYLSPDMYTILYNNLIENDADISTCGYYRCYHDKNVPNFKECSTDIHILSPEEAIRGVFEDKIVSVEAWAKIYKTSLFDNVRYPVSRLSEDAFTTPTLLSKAKKIVATTQPLLYYSMREDSITGSNFKKGDLDVIDAYELNLKLVRDKFPSLLKQAEFRVLWAYTYVLKKMLKSRNFNDFDEYHKIISTIRKNTFKILANPYFSIQKKVAVCCLLFSKKLYKKLVLSNVNHN